MKYLTLKKKTVGLATLLEGAGYTFKIFECKFQIFILFWWKVCVKLAFYIKNETINGYNVVWTSLRAIAVKVF